MNFYKYHALGNDYIVMDPQEGDVNLTPDRIRLICHRHFGVGSDGILFGPVESESCDFGLQIYNPDGSEAEKSGNGLRIFSRYLWDRQRVDEKPFTIQTPGGDVESRVHEDGRMVTVEMGRVTFLSREIPVAGPSREVVDERLHVLGRDYSFSAAGIGNPHCVLPCDEISKELAEKIGPIIENDPRFPNRINVQLLKVIDRNTIRIEIWERGAGYTLASGSSSSAAAAVARKLGLCDRDVTVIMPGGCLEISIDDDYQITMTGPVTAVSHGVIDDELFTQELTT
jgi:diaminopimelate epimerase